jgi:hypothetical protein
MQLNIFIEYLLCSKLGTEDRHEYNIDEDEEVQEISIISILHVS